MLDMDALLAAGRWLEEFGRRGLFTFLMHGSARERSAAPDALTRGPFRVLFIAEDAIGDTILTLPSIRAVAESHPGNVVDVATWSGAAEVLQHAPYVRRAIVFPRYDRRRVVPAIIVHKHGPYDVIIDTMVLCRHVRSRSFAMMLASGARYWVGEDDRGSDYLLNVTARRPPVPITHLERMLALAAPFRSAQRDRRPLLRIGEAQRAGAASTWGAEHGQLRVLVNVSTNGSERQWPPSCFARVTAHLRRRLPSARILVVAMEHHRPGAELVASAGSAAVMIPTLSQLLALVASADIVVSPDTAVCHLASAFRRPLVSIHNYGKDIWHPFDTPGVRVVGPTSDSFDDIGADRVVAAFDRVLADHAVQERWDHDSPLGTPSEMEQLTAF